MSVGASLTRNQMVKTEANDTNLRTTYSVENTRDMEIMSVKIQENRKNIFELFLMFDDRVGTK